ncbi:MAG: zinc ribbon domain-containing protein [Gammaproteobacteria bacterium]|nr:zinc ribbon domain-containing protein [Gammaproteobacteria bacterium]
MPIYEYQCQTCGHGLEVLQKLRDEPLQDCPSCGDSALKKKVSAVAFRLKGGGWYETDFKTGDKKNIAGDKPSSDTSSKSTGKDSSSGGESSSGNSSSGNSSSGNSSSSSGKSSSGNSGSGKSSSGNSTTTT